MMNKGSYMRKILVIDAHPYNKSFCKAIADSYYEGAIIDKDKNKNKNKNLDEFVERVNLRDLKFDPILHAGYVKSQKLEKDLIKVQKLVDWCEHLVIVTPVWWGSSPALLKGFFDRLFLPGWAFSFGKYGKINKLLKGRSSTVIYTQDAPKFASLLFFSDSFWKHFKKYVISFCGFSPVKRVYFGSVSGDSRDKVEYRENILKKCKELGKHRF